MDLNSEHLSDIQPFFVMAILARAKELEAQGKDIIHLEVGEPDFRTPDAIVERARDALLNENLGYTPANGILALRQAIAQYYKDQFQVDIHPNRIFITTGASGALQLAMKACVPQNQSLLLTEPGYPCNANIAKVMGITTEICQLNSLNQFQPTVKNLSNQAKKAKAPVAALLIASPGNPTGTLIPSNTLNEISELCQQHSWQLILDEIYSNLSYDDNQPVDTILNINSDAWVVQSFSKYFQMTGWRLGWLVVPEEYESKVMKLAQNLFLSPPSISQYAALSCFEPETLMLLEQRRAILNERRVFMISALEAIGFTLASPANGAFYIYVDASKFTNDSKQFCEDMLEEACVAATPGVDFGGSLATTTIRFAYTQDIERIKVAVSRIQKFIQKKSRN